MTASQVIKSRPPDAIRIATFAWTIVRVLSELERKHRIPTGHLIEIGRECVAYWCKARRVSNQEFERHLRQLEATSSASLTRH